MRRKKGRKRREEEGHRKRKGKGKREGRRMQRVEVARKNR